MPVRTPPPTEIEYERSSAPPDAAGVIRPGLPVDLRLTLSQVSLAGTDLVLSRDRAGAWWRATRTPDGPATVRYVALAKGAVDVRAWGPGAAWGIEAAPEIVGARDSLDGFAPAPRTLVAELHHRFPGLRIPRTKAVFEALVPAILGQKVTAVEAGRARRGMVRAWGEPAPGPGARLGLRVPPSPATVAGHPYEDFHALGVERRRAETLRFAASRAARLEEALAMAPDAALRRLRAIPGVGPWTAAGVAGVALGDADAVLVGDYHMPNTVAWALAREPRGNDERMLELLAPYAGHRARVIRLLAAAGIEAPKFGPRSTVRSIGRM